MQDCWKENLIGQEKTGMGKRNVKFAVEYKLCSSCGICKNVCPKKCISWKRENGLYLPEINENVCIQCGICANVCSGLGFTYDEHKIEVLESVIGDYKEIYNAWSRNEELRHVSASGGVVSSLIQKLLTDDGYDFAFCVDTYDYNNQVLTKPKSKEDFNNEWISNSTPKSRYLPVSHENAVSFMKEHKDAKIILTGTSCAVRGLLSVIEQFKLDRENYLLIGLFCDKVFNYNIYSYFQNKFCGNKTLVSLHFKNKESGGWPGNMKFQFEDDTYLYQDKVERAKAKEYFMPERCLYCIDKLNVCADISLGDNYTDQDSSDLGSNSVIVRTKRGMTAWNMVRGVIECQPVSIGKIRSAQYLDGRINNVCFGVLKENDIKKKNNDEIVLNKNIVLNDNPYEYKRAWKRNLEVLHAGETYHLDPGELDKQEEKSKKLQNPKSLVSIYYRLYYAIKRRIR